MKAELNGAEEVDFDAWEYGSESGKLLKAFQAEAAQTVLDQIGEEADAILVSLTGPPWISINLWEEGPFLQVDLRKVLLDGFSDLDDLDEDPQGMETLLETLKGVLAEVEDRVTAAVAKAKSP